jgi:hypothetical protein
LLRALQGRPQPLARNLTAHHMSSRCRDIRNCVGGPQPTPRIRFAENAFSSPGGADAYVCPSARDQCMEAPTAAGTRENKRRNNSFRCEWGSFRNRAIASQSLSWL